MERLVDAMTQIRDRCVWTQTIDHEALVPYLIEESYELVEAIETGTRDDLVEELGDVLWQVLFHSEIASRDGDSPFDLQDVAQAALDKMVPRHPHVFGDDVATTPDEVMTLWLRAKAAEKSTRTSVLDGIPMGMPALALADKVLSRGRRVGVAPHPTPAPAPAPASAPAPGSDTSPSPTPPLPDVDQADALDDAAADTARAEREVGWQLLAQVEAARSRGLDAERALRTAIRELSDRIADAETAPVSTTGAQTAD